MRIIGIVTIFFALAAGYYFWVLDNDPYLSPKWLVDDGMLNAEQVQQTIDDLRDGIVPELVSDSPDLSGWLFNRLSTHQITTQSDTDNDQNIDAYSMLLAQLHLIGQWTEPSGWYRESYSALGVSRYIDFCRKLVNRADLMLWKLDHVSDSLVANVMAGAGFQDAGCFTISELNGHYSKAEKHKDGITRSQKVMLRLIWKMSFPAESKFLSSIEFEKIKESIERPADFIELLVHENSEVVIASTNSIRLLAPAAALPALRYQLIASNVEEERLAVLSAMEVYGSRVRPYIPQLKLLMANSDSQALRAGIKKLIDSNRGL
ncbi:MAG: hypothetical protein CMI67_21820 [Pelagibaca sp.]|nr:hypothetical protein [Pelagibaca sp.]